MRPPLLITGCPRSGTSLTAHVFEALGCWAGTTTSQCENTAIREQVLKPILRESGMDELALRSFADEAAGDPAMLRRGVIRILEDQGYEAGPWLYKDCKLVFCWPLWAEAFPDATWVTVWRRPSQIRASMARWGLARRIHFDSQEVVDEHHARAREIPDAHTVFPGHLIHGDHSEYRAAAEAYGLTWDAETARGEIDLERFVQ